MSTPAANENLKSAAPARGGSRADAAKHGAGLFDIRNIIGALMLIYGIVLLFMSFGQSTAEKAKAGGANLNLWTGLGLLVVGLLLVAWARLRPIIVVEEQLEADKAETEAMGNPNIHDTHSA